jgi:site-specific recombinase XerD
LRPAGGKGFVGLRDKALIRLYANTGARLSEVGKLLVTDVDMNTESVHVHGKGAKDRRVRFGPKTRFLGFLKATVMVSVQHRRRVMPARTAQAHGLRRVKAPGASPSYCPRGRRRA